VRLARYLRLPASISDFERRYLCRVNKYATAFLVLNVPVFVVIATLNRTNPGLALALSSLVVAGPVLAERVVDDPRRVSLVFAVAGMGMGGLLVHFGQGPMQIEMHFYFFVLMALLTVFGNPGVILLAAATVVLHHLVIWLVFPSSVFNYAASAWVIGVHGAFVLLEAAVCCFVARMFFDNVIGLERLVAQRTAELAARNGDMKLMLDTVGQGFVRVGVDGTMGCERSATLEAWLGPAADGERIFEYLGRQDPAVAPWLETGLEAIVEDVLPADLALSQLPQRMVAGRRTLRIAYEPVVSGGKITSLLVILSDVSAELARADVEAEKADMVAMFERIMVDRAGFAEFIAEAQELVQATVRGAASPADTLRYVHTLKGNALLAGMAGFARVCHDLESYIAERDEVPGAAMRAAFEARWRATTAKVEGLIGSRARVIELSEADYDELVTAVSSGRPRLEILQIVDDLRLEPNVRRLERIAEDARAVARRIGRDVTIEIEAGNVRLSRDKWAGLWASVIHIVRNALDHGIESTAERVARGKPPRGRITLATGLDGDEYVVTFADDGRGVDWAKVAEVAAARGLPHETAAELEAVIFTDGVTTRDQVSDYSGRGVGMAAVLAETRKLGGRVRVRSEKGRGTKVELRFPQSVRHEPCRPGVERRMSGGIRTVVPPRLSSPGAPAWSGPRL
jgi:two-component system chemotaxis sensor kinase CheA